MKNGYELSEISGYSSFAHENSLNSPQGYGQMRPNDKIPPVDLKPICAHLSCIVAIIIRMHTVTTNVCVNPIIHNISEVY